MADGRIDDSLVRVVADIRSLIFLSEILALVAVDAPDEKTHQHYEEEYNREDDCKDRSLVFHSPFSVPKFSNRPIVTCNEDRADVVVGLSELIFVHKRRRSCFHLDWRVCHWLNSAEVFRQRYKTITNLETVPRKM